MKKLLIALLFVSFTMTTMFASSKTGTVTLGVGGGDLDIIAIEKVVDEYMKQNPDVNVKIHRLPSSYSEKLAYYLQLFEVKSGDLDIMQVDNIWLGDIENNLLDLTEYGAKEVADQMFDNMVANNIVNNKIIGLPWIADAGTLFYRKDLLEEYGLKEPETWHDLIIAANKIQEGEREKGNPDFVGFIWQGEADECLTCNALEWIHSNDGGTIISDDKKVTLYNKNAVDTINMVASMVGTISPKGVLSMKEDESKNVFVSGNAAFIRSWPYVYDLAQNDSSPIKGKVELCPIPGIRPELRSGVTGLESFCVNKYSENPELAADLVLFLTSEQSQKTIALTAGLAPTISSLYTNEEVMKQKPQIAVFKNIFDNTINRPSLPAAPNYGQVSKIFYNSVHQVLMGEKDANIALQEAADEISKITGYPLESDI